MILGGTLAKEADVEDPMGFLFFPLMVHAFDILVSSLGILTISTSRKMDRNDPMRTITVGLKVASAFAFVGFVRSTRWLLYTDKSPNAWLHFLGCGVVGMLTSIVFINSTQYFTDYKYWPVRSIAQASQGGHGLNIITGMAVGMRSTVVPVLAVSVAVVSSYHLGKTSGMGSGHSAGLFGTAVATMGMLSSACYVLAVCTPHSPFLLFFFFFLGGGGGGGCCFP